MIIPVFTAAKRKSIPVFTAATSKSRKSIPVFTAAKSAFAQRSHVQVRIRASKKQQSPKALLLIPIFAKIRTPLHRASPAAAADEAQEAAVEEGQQEAGGQEVQDVAGHVAGA